jgi:hypothetical protein
VLRVEVQIMHLPIEMTRDFEFPCSVRLSGVRASASPAVAPSIEGQTVTVLNGLIGA